MVMSQFSALNTILKDAKVVFLSGHVNPDSDSMGSALAVASMLRRMGKEVTVFRANNYPYNGMFLTGSDGAVTELPEAEPDLWFLVDCATPQRTGDAFFRRMSASKARKVALDHHEGAEENGDFYDFQFSDPEACAAAAVIWRWGREIGWRFDRDESEALCFGVFGDTGGLRYANTNRETFAMVGELSENFDYAEFCSQIYENESINRFRMLSEVIESMSVLAGGQAIIFRTTLDQLEKYDLTPDVVDALVDDVRSIGTVKLVFRIREVERGCVWKFSIRSSGFRGNIDCIPIAKKYGGGGHRNAAGFTFNGSYEDAFAYAESTVHELLGR